jgi:peptidoglycan-N-acetylglucosamine deacetylase
MFKTCVKAAKLLLPRGVCIHRLGWRAGDSVLLTFDDGPHPQTTSAVLDRLRAFDARAIFFVVGNRIPRAPHILRRIIDEGHFVGNHTFTHRLDCGLRYREYLDDLTRCQNDLLRCSGVRPRFHRPPMGQLSFASLMAPKRLGLTTVMWSCSAEDWRFRSDAMAMERAEQMATEVRAGDIILFHDERSHTLVALDYLLPTLKSRGLSFRPDMERLL